MVTETEPEWPTSPLQEQHLRLLFAVMFFFSGMLSLIYELCWVRTLTLELGSTATAIATVLTLFMLGLAIGAYLGGQIKHMPYSPLLIYGMLECLTAVYVVVSTLIFRGSLPLMLTTAVSQADVPWVIHSIRGLAAMLLLLPPTIMMGATLPILACFLERQKRQLDADIGRFYGLNTAGACTGVLVGGLVMLPMLGLTNALHFAAVANFVLGIAAVGTAWSTAGNHVTPSAEALPPLTVRWPVALAVGLNGFGALVCQVLWTRVLNLVIGASTYSFTVVLSTFLIGSAAGAFLAAYALRRNPGSGTKAYRVVASASGLSIATAAITFQLLPSFFLYLFWAWNLQQHFHFVLYAQFLICTTVMLIPTMLFGATFTMAIGAELEGKSGVNRQVGAIYTANTIGAILGSLFAGFIVLPYLGIRVGILTAIASQLASAAVFNWRPGMEMAAAKMTGTAAALMVVAMIITPQWQAQLMSSGMYQYARRYNKGPGQSLRETLAQTEQLKFYKDGRSATVTVTESRQGEQRKLYITTNGKIDGSSHFDMGTQRISAHLPLLLHPAPEKTCIIGLGTGCTSGSAALHGGEVVTLEVEPAMIEAAEHFNDHNHRVSQLDNVDIRATDGRLHLRLHPEQYDVIISEPSNPWISGISDLFTLEFFRLGKDALRADGLFCQWVQLYGLAPENFKTIVRTFQAVFPHCYVVTTIEQADVILLGSMSSLELDLKDVWSRMQTRNIRQDLADPRVGIWTVYDLAARFRLGPREVANMVSEGVYHTDDRPIIAYRAPKDLYKETRAENSKLLAKHANGVAPYLNLQALNPQEARVILEQLERAYFRFKGASGNEAQTCKTLRDYFESLGSGPTTAPK